MTSKARNPDMACAVSGQAGLSRSVWSTVRSLREVSPRQDSASRSRLNQSSDRHRWESSPADQPVSPKSPYLPSRSATKQFSEHASEHLSPSQSSLPAWPPVTQPPGPVPEHLPGPPCPCVRERPPLNVTGSNPNLSPTKLSPNDGPFEACSNLTCETICSR
ncbi:hypothetical protein NL676_029910 [Syzygium grande]|nr:hypothetical protein NL676_029910 [Syzygium grande]